MSELWSQTRRWLGRSHGRRHILRTVAIIFAAAGAVAAAVPLYGLVEIARGEYGVDGQFGLDKPIVLARSVPIIAILVAGLVLLGLGSFVAHRNRDLPTGGSREAVIGGRHTGSIITAEGRLENLAFLCHSSGDKERVRELHRRLKGSSVPCWFDEEALVAGQDFDLEIRRAIKASRYVIACLSESSISKTGYVQKELRFALDRADEQPDGTIFLIPLRLEPCNVPDRLQHLHWIDLFEPRGYERLLAALRPATQS